MQKLTRHKPFWNKARLSSLIKNSLRQALTYHMDPYRCSSGSGGNECTTGAGGLGCNGVGRLGQVRFIYSRCLKYILLLSIQRVLLVVVMMMVLSWFILQFCGLPCFVGLSPKSCPWCVICYSPLCFVLLSTQKCPCCAICY